MRSGRLLLASLALLLCAGVPAFAVPNQEGDLFVTFDGDLHPRTLPRETAVPVAVRVAGDVRSVSGNDDSLPQLRRIAVKINREGKLFDRGLPTCSVQTIQPSTEAAARRLCRGAIVGSGHVHVQVRIPGQPPFIVKARLLAFNGPRRNGDKLIFAQAYGLKPPGAFILTFRVSRRAGTFGTVLSTTLPRVARDWAYMTHFDMTLHRVYSYRGKRRSFISAACPAPPGFTSILFPFARATYRFDNGQRLTTGVARTCYIT